MRSSGWCHIEDPGANASPQPNADVSQYCSDQTMVRTRPHVLSEAEVAPSRRREMGVNYYRSSLPHDRRGR